MVNLKQYILDNFGEDKLLDYLVSTLNETLGQDSYYNSLKKYVKVNVDKESVFDLTEISDVLTDYEITKINSINTVLNNEDLSFCSEEELNKIYSKLELMGG